MKARKAALRVYHRHAILNWVAFTEAPVKSLLPRPNLETICIIHVAHHDTHTMHNGNVGVKGARASRTSAVRTEKTSADECEEVGSLAPVFIASPPPAPHPMSISHAMPSPSHLLAPLLLVLLLLLGTPPPQLSSPNPHFSSDHLSAWLETLVYYHIIIVFIITPTLHLIKTVQDSGLWLPLLQPQPNISRLAQDDVCFATQIPASVQNWVELVIRW